MANYSSIAIGINRYQFIQPLSYAQADAQAIHSFLVEETELPAAQALLLTDASPWLDNQSTYPTREAILQWLQPPARPVQRPFLWFFFSGYAAHQDGRDYLLPIDANPTDPAATGIPAEQVVELLAQHGAEHIVLLLDINRSPNPAAGANIGAEIVQMAQDKGLICVLSCQLEETSHESMALGHGMFAVALLEVLRYYRHDLTLDRLARYLCDRLPELSQHHWRPVQNPLILMPSLDLVERSLLPVAVESDGDEPVASRETSAAAPVLELDQEDSLSNGKGSATALTDPGNGRNGNSSLQLPTFGNGGEEPPSEEPTGGVDDIREDIAPAIPPASTARARAPRWRWLLWGSAALAIALLAAWLWSRRQPAVVDAPTEPVAESPAVEPASEPPAATAPAPTDAETAAVPSPATAPEGAGSPAASPTEGNAAGTEDAPATTDAGADTSAETTNTTTPETTDATAAAATGGQAPAPSATAAAAPQTVGASRAILARARTFIQSNQASGFSRAIIEARKIPPGAPLYDEARNDIQRWSQVILDIARGRAARGQFDSAIAAAKLVSPDQGAIYQDAQQHLARWPQQAQQQATNLKVISDARRTIDYTQASSYNQAISMLQAIPPGQPGHLEAQALRDRWSKQIYLIANSRAAQGNLDQAIATAQLVPVNTSHYEQAQAAIARWQQS